MALREIDLVFADDAIHGSDAVLVLDLDVRPEEGRGGAVFARPDDPSRAFFGAYVTIEDDDGTEATYRIVGPDEFDVDNGWISMDSPVAKALLGRREGDEVMVRRPKGDVIYTIVAIAYRDD